MDRRTLIGAAGLMPLWAMAQQNPRLKTKMPVLFLAHGHPYNAIVRKRYGNLLYTLGQRLHPRPRAILVISSHWITHSGTQVLGASNPRTILDFQGLPAEYSKIDYPAPGSPQMARETAALLDPYVTIRDDWGFDQAVWIILRHLAPEAAIPVYMLSIDPQKKADYHYLLGKMLEPLRNMGVLIIGSGNIVHNPNRTENAQESHRATQGWANSFAHQVRAAVAKRDDQALLNYHMMDGAQHAVPTPEHFLPLLYALGAARGDGGGSNFYSTFQEGTIGMHSWMFG